jgi:hypothetical protein
LYAETKLNSNGSRRQPRKPRQRESEFCETNCTRSRWIMPIEQPFSVKTERFYLAPPKSLGRKTMFT